jgi:hypothetical protein
MLFVSQNINTAAYVELLSLNRSNPLQPIQYLTQQTAQSITIIFHVYPHRHVFRPLQGHHQGGIHSTKAYKYKKFCQIRALIELKCNIIN